VPRSRGHASHKEGNLVSRATYTIPVGFTQRVRLSLDGHDPNTDSFRAGRPGLSTQLRAPWLGGRSTSHAPSEAFLGAAGTEGKVSSFVPMVPLEGGAFAPGSPREIRRSKMNACGKHPGHKKAGPGRPPSRLRINRILVSEGEEHGRHQVIARAGRSEGPHAGKHHGAGGLPHDRPHMLDQTGGRPGQGHTPSVSIGANSPRGYGGGGQTGAEETSTT